MGKWQLSSLIILVKYLNEVCPYTWGSVWTRTAVAIWLQSVSAFVAVNATNWYVNVCWPNSVCVCVLKTQVTAGTCTHGKLYNNVVRGKNVAAHVTTLATTIDSDLNLSNFLPIYEGNALLVLLLK